METYEVQIEKTIDDHTAFTKVLRIVGRMTLKQASDIAQYMISNHGGTLVAGVEKETAEYICYELKSIGIVASSKKSAISTPMICHFEANNRYKWGRFRTIVRLK